MMEVESIAYHVKGNANVQNEKKKIIEKQKYEWCSYFELLI